MDKRIFGVIFTIVPILLAYIFLKYRQEQHSSAQVQGRIRSELMQKLWHGIDPFKSFPDDLYELELFTPGWDSNNQHLHPYLTDTIDLVQPSIIVELGVWKGASVVSMALHLKKLRLDAVIIAVDIWLDGDELFLHKGYSRSFLRFMNNIFQLGLENYVLPLPLDSVNAVRVFRHFGIKPDIVHVDANHYYPAIKIDLSEWWPEINNGGALIGDDYGISHLPDVKPAFDDYFGAMGMTPIEYLGKKCRIRKLT